MKNIFRVLWSLVRPSVWILESHDKTIKKALKIIYIGTKKQKNHIVRTLFNDAYDELYLGKKFIWHAYYLVNKNKYKCSLAIIEGTFIDKFLYNSTQDFLLPLWIESFVDLPLVPKTKSAKKDLKTVAKNSLEYIVTKDPKLIDDFYHNMYTTMIKNRYKNEALEFSYSTVKKKIEDESNEFILIKKDDIFIAGSVISISSDIPLRWANGIRNTKYWKCGAIAAIYIFTSEYLYKKGYKKVSFGYTRSFLKDGVLNYKRKWDITLKKSSQKGYILKPLKTNEALEDFFINNPFIYLYKNKLYGAIFINEDENYSKEDYKKLQKQYYTKGLSGLNVFSINQESGFIKKRQQDIADFK